ncbi:MAG: GDSL-type esterase/lipase family protein [Streptosporangiaceae bacterium]
MTTVPAAAEFADQTLRQILHLHRGGSRLRLHLSNLFGKDPLTIGGLRIARHLGGGRVEGGADLGGLVIPVGESVVTEPVDFEIADDSELAVDLHVPGPTGLATYHPYALQTGYLGDGDQRGAQRLPTKFFSLFWITGVDVVEADPAGRIVAFGDSLTDGGGSTHGAHRRFPDELSRRLGRPVLNLGIGGNRLLNDGFGEPGIVRFDRDVLGVPWVSHVLIELGINDLGLPGRLGLPDKPDAARLIAGLTGLAERARAAGIRPILATLPPFRNADFPGYFSEESELTRAEVNTWIRGTGAVLDIAVALEEPGRAGFLNPEFDCGDHLHPNDRGAHAMAHAIDTDVFEVPTPG